MSDLPPAARDIAAEIGRRHGFGAHASATMFEALLAGNGGMAQFNHPELGGQGQWMRGGMTMVPDLFDHALKARVDAVFRDFSAAIERDPALARGVDDAPQGAARRDWWPAGLTGAASTGSQNGARYAFFPEARRLAVDTGGAVTVYDTQEHRIGGFSQQQGPGSSMRFTSQHGNIDLASLPVVSSSSSTPAAADSATAGAARDSVQATRLGPSRHRGDEPPARTGGSAEALATLERLAELRSKGVLSEQEFAAKKAELLSRI